MRQGRAVRAESHPTAGAPAGGAPASALERRDYAGLHELPAGERTPRSPIRALREARERLCAAAASADESAMERALDGFVTAAWEAGFLRATADSVVAVVLESELPRRGSRSRRRALVERWVRRARELYDRRAGAG